MKHELFLLGGRVFGPLLLPLVFLILQLLGRSPYVQAVPIQLYGLNYNTRKGPDFYPDVLKCKTRAEILTELQLLRKITSRIRLLSLTDCGQAELVLDILSNELSTSPMQLWLGLWVGSETWVYEEEYGELVGLVQRGLLDTNTVLGITVGSEAIYREDATEAQIIEHVTRVKSLLQNNPPLADLPVTSVDIAPNYNILPNLRASVDVIMTNTFPFWEGIPIEAAVYDLQQDISYLRSLPNANNKPFVLGETGWPSDGFIPGVGIASPENQLYFFRDFYCNVHVQQGMQYYWFTGINNDWRQIQDPENTIEGNWGIWDANLQLKPHFEGFRFTCPSNGVEYSFAEIDWTVERNTPAPAPLNPASCQAHPQCATLAGNCCPNDGGLSLACCGPLTSPPPPPPTRAPIAPTNRPVPPPTRLPTKAPTLLPTLAPTTAVPNPFPTGSPTTVAPSPSPSTVAPTRNPTDRPSTAAPTTESPTKSPLASPITHVPTVEPTTLAPIVGPTTDRPTTFPTFRPTTEAPVVVTSATPTTTPVVVVVVDDTPTVSPAPFLSNIVSRQDTPVPTTSQQREPVLIDAIDAAASRSGAMGRHSTLVMAWIGLFGWCCCCMFVWL